MPESSDHSDLSDREFLAQWDESRTYLQTFESVARLDAEADARTDRHDMADADFWGRSRGLLDALTGANNHRKPWTPDEWHAVKRALRNVYARVYAGTYWRHRSPRLSIDELTGRVESLTGGAPGRVLTDVCDAARRRAETDADGAAALLARHNHTDRIAPGDLWTMSPYAQAEDLLFGAHAVDVVERVTEDRGVTVDSDCARTRALVDEFRARAAARYCTAYVEHAPDGVASVLRDMQPSADAFRTAFAPRDGNR
jgi:hypothetical protein